MTNVSWLDFNDAADQADMTNHNAQLDAQDIKQQLIQRLPEMLSDLFPKGKARNQQFFIGDLQGNSGKSLVIELGGPKAGMWIDFATDEQGDAFDLWAGVTGQDAKRDFGQIVRDVADRLGHKSPSEHDYMPTKQNQPVLDELGSPTGKWDYTDGQGQLIACVYRYDTPEGKQYRPWDVKARKTQAPEPRPLYNQQQLATVTDVILVEGEKSADALIGLGIPATTAMNGSNAPIDKTDWSPLANKNILIWPDKDSAGWEYAQKVGKALAQQNVSTVAILEPPEDKSEKWDAADAVAEKVDIKRFLDTAEKHIVKYPNKGLQLSQWTAQRYAGEAPTMRYLVEQIFPIGVVSILAAMGDTGKGMITLDLALKIATGSPPKSSLSPTSESFGHRVLEYGAAVIFTAEDDVGEVHRRLDRLDPFKRRLEHPERLIVVPLPNAGGSLPLVQLGSNGAEETAHFRMIKSQLHKIPDLKLVVFDPLSSFIFADVNADPAAGSFSTGLLSSLATDLEAAVIVAHHMRKPASGKAITTVEQARDAIRGTSALVDGVRLAYALWPASEERQLEVFNVLNKPYQRNAIYEGAVVKANGLADRNISRYCRADSGLLEDVTRQLLGATHTKEDLQEMLVGAIKRSAKGGHPFTHTGGSGVFRQRHRLPTALHSISRHRLEKMVQELLNGRPPTLVKGKAFGSYEDKWLDVKDGPFAQGEGEFLLGAETIKSGDQITGFN